MRNLLFILTLLTVTAACSSQGPLVSEYMDARTGVTVTNARTPLVLYRDHSARAAHARDFVYVGPLAVNRMGDYQYYLWLGIWSSMPGKDLPEQRDGFESIVIFADGEPLYLEVQGWTLSSIGVSRPVYSRPTATAADAYYPVTLDQVRMIAQARDIRLKSGSPMAASYEPWDSQQQALSGMQAFVRSVTY